MQLTALRDFETICKRLESEYRADFALSARMLVQKRLEAQYELDSRDEMAIDIQQPSPNGGLPINGSRSRIISGLERRQIGLERRIASIRAIYSASVQLRHDSIAASGTARVGHSVQQAMQSSGVNASDLANSLLRIADGDDGNRTAGSDARSGTILPAPQQPNMSGAVDPFDQTAAGLATPVDSALDELRDHMCVSASKHRDWIGVDLCETDAAINAVLLSGACGLEWLPEDLLGGGSNIGTAVNASGGISTSTSSSQDDHRDAESKDEGTQQAASQAGFVPIVGPDCPTLGLAAMENRGRRAVDVLTPGGTYCLAVVPQEVLPAKPRNVATARDRSESKQSQSFRGPEPRSATGRSRQ